MGATKYFHGLAAGDVPLNFLFSGTVFLPDAGRASTSRLLDLLGKKNPSSKLPLSAWKNVIDSYYPNTRLALPAPGRL